VLRTGALMELLEDEYDFVRCAAVRAISTLANRRQAIAAAAADGLSAALFDDSATVRIAALAALASCAEAKAPTAGVMKAIRAALDDAVPAVRLAAVMCAILYDLPAPAYGLVYGVSRHGKGPDCAACHQTRCCAMRSVHRLCTATWLI
jgi:HEAT repeat protein